MAIGYPRLAAGQAAFRLSMNPFFLSPFSFLLFSL